MSGMLRVRWLLPLLLLAVSACATPPPRPGEARIPDGAWISHRAVFIGESNHDTVGTISLYQSGKYPVIVFEPNFRVSAAPDAVVALGNDGYRADTVLGALLHPAGQQAYALPPGLDIRLFNEVWLWSPTADEPVGLARLTPI
jgi:hypothetical protein